LTNKGIGNTSRIEDDTSTKGKDKREQFMEGTFREKS